MEEIHQGIYWGMCLMLFVAGYLLMDGVRLVKRSNRIINDQLALLNEMMELIHYQHGLIIALRAGVISPWHLGVVDLSNLPIELRLKILHALITVGVEHYHGRQPSEDSNGSGKVDGANAEGP